MPYEGLVTALFVLWSSYTLGGMLFPNPPTGMDPLHVRYPTIIEIVRALFPVTDTPVQRPRPVLSLMVSRWIVVVHLPWTSSTLPPAWYDFACRDIIDIWIRDCRRPLWIMGSIYELGPWIQIWCGGDAMACLSQQVQQCRLASAVDCVGNSRSRHLSCGMICRVHSEKRFEPYGPISG
jgi:hypothetical protein